jgi:nitrate reductase gamma subunit
MSDYNNTDASQKNDAIISYLLLRQLIGILGILLPFILIAGNYLFSNCNYLQPSISHYYYSIMHIVFVGTLCVLGGFLITYRGKSRFENRVSNCAGACAFGVAIFPTAFNGFINPADCNCQFIQLKTAEPIPGYIGYMHYGFAALLFICFTIFCFRIFQDPDVYNPNDVKKKLRNKIYRVCGYIIVASIIAIAAIAVYDRITGKDNFPYSTFIFETTSLLPFGFSWLLKGSLNWKNSKSAILRKTVQYVR